MSVSRADATTFLNLAIESENPFGIGVECANKREATAFAQVLNRTRVEARKESTKIYNREDPGYNKSSWEYITCRLKPHPKLNPLEELELPWIVVATSSEHLAKQLKLVDPFTGDPLDLDLEELL